MWQPISTAPAGDWNADIDIWDGKQRIPSCFWGTPEGEDKPCWCFSEYVQNFGSYSVRVYNPVCWMPVPEPPQDTHSA